MARTPAPSRPRPTSVRRATATIAGLALVAATGTLPAAAAPGHHDRAATPASAPVATSPAASGIVGEAPLPDGAGLWVAYADGVVVPIGAARSYGDLAGKALDAPIRAIASTADGKGYWLLGSDGGIFTFGDARFFGSTGGIRLHQPVVAMAATADDRGYWLVASDGGIFTFGDARFHGSTGGIRLDRPIVGMAAAPGGAGYWLVASDGGIFSFGSATFAGSTGGLRLASPVVGMAATPTGRGYWLVSSDGGVFTFGDATWHGSAAGTLGGSQAVGIIPSHGGYWIPTTAGTVRAFGAPNPATTPVPGSVPAPTPTHAPTPAPTPTRVNPLANPPASQAPPAGFAKACYSPDDNTACDAIALQAVDTARAQEGLGPMSLPAGFPSLTAAEQIVVVTNAERTSRGLPALAGPTAGLDALAGIGAATGTDPRGPAGTSWASNWAGGVGTPLAADYLWMYDDGLDSGNIDCEGSVTSGCWGHRENILVPWAGSMGAATAAVDGWTSMTELMVAD